jgi:hypothetical protein
LYSINNIFKLLPAANKYHIHFVLPEHHISIHPKAAEKRLAVQPLYNEKASFKGVAEREGHPAGVKRFRAAGESVDG